MSGRALKEVRPYQVVQGKKGVSKKGSEKEQPTGGKASGGSGSKSKEEPGPPFESAPKTGKPGTALDKYLKQGK